MLLRSRIVRLCLIPTYSCKFVYKKDWRLVKDNTNWSAYMDDLRINEETYQFSTSYELLKAVRENPENDFYMKTIGQLLYHLGKEGIYDEEVLKKIEKCLYKFKGEFTPRLAFGAYYGLIALSVENKYLLSFIEQEYRNDRIDNTDWVEAVDMMEACSRNKNLTKEYLRSIIKSYCQPILIQSYKKFLRFQPKSQLKLLDACIKAKYFESKLFSPLVKDLVAQVRLNRLPDLLQLLETLRNLESSGDCPRTIKSEIGALEARIRDTPKYNWLYDVDNNRYRTMEELKAKREQIPQQYTGYHLLEPQYLEQYLQNKALGNDEQINREKKIIQEKQLDDLLYDEFMLNKIENQRNTKEKKKGIKEDDEMDVGDEEFELTQEEKKDLLTDFQTQHFQTLDMENIDPDMLPPEWFQEEGEEEGSNDFDELDEKIKEAAENKKKYHQKPQALKRRKGRTGKIDELFDGLE